MPLAVRTVAGNAVKFAASTPILVPRQDVEAMAAARYLKALMLETRGLRLSIYVERNGVPRPRAIRFLRGAAGSNAEAYSLDVDRRGATVRANSKAGLLYGAVTLWQLLTAPGASARGGASLTPVHIDDQPRFPWRGLLLDSARHYQSVAFIERMIDWMALHKLNVLEWHLTDDQAWRLQIQTYPRLTQVGGWRPDGQGGAYGGIYTQAQVRALVAFAAKRNVTIVPEIEMPGHALAAIVAYPNLGLDGGVTPKALNDWGVFPSVLNVDDHTFDFLETVLGEVMSIFPSPYIAVGGDEAVKDAWRASPQIQARMKSLGIANEIALQSWFTRRIGDYLNAHGRRLVGWDDVLQGGDLPTGDVVVSWHAVDGAVAAAQSGHDVVLATDPILYFDHRQSARRDEPPGRGGVVSLADVYAYDPGDPPLPPPPTPPSGPATATLVAGPLPPFVMPISPLATPRLFLTPEEKRHILGLQANIWTEHIRTEQRLVAMAFPRAAAVAESGWTAEQNRSWTSFVARLPAQFARYRALGLAADDSAFAVLTSLASDGAKPRVSLDNQVRAGDIHYTTDGARPSADSPVYQAPLDLYLPAHLEAATFIDGVRVSPVLDERLDEASIRRRASQELKLCTEKISLNLEDTTAADAAHAAVLTDIMNPCWTYTGADLAGIGALSAGVERLPFNYQLGADVKKIVLRPPATPDGELVVHLDTCEGELLAVMPLSRAVAGVGVTLLKAEIPPHAGRHDLCFSFTAKHLDPMWVLAWAQLDAGTQHVTAEP